jgi:hypothetical protein
LNKKFLENKIIKHDFIKLGHELSEFIRFKEKIDDLSKNKFVSINIFSQEFIKNDFSLQSSNIG